MRKMLLAAMLALVSMGVVAQPAYYIANEIPYAEKDKIAQRVVNGCTRLGTDFSTYMVLNVIYSTLNYVYCVLRQRNLPFYLTTNTLAL